MKAGYNINDVATQIKKAIYEEDINTKTQQKMTNTLVAKGYNLGYISQVLEGNVVFETLSFMDIGVFASVIYRDVGVNYLNPEIYFNDLEIEKIQKHRNVENDDTLSYPVVFEDVRQVASDMWSVILPVDFIARLGKSNMLRYNHETQRDPKIIKTSRGDEKDININIEAVAEIESELIKGEFIANSPLTFNMLLQDSSKIKYDRRFNRLLLLDGKLDIIDGYHRFKAITTALTKADLNYNFNVSITNFSQDKAKKFIVQEDKRTPISSDYIQSINNSDMITQIINQLNQNSVSELRGKITTDRATIVSGISLVTFKTMHNSLDRLFDPKTINQADVIFEKLRRFYNQLIDIKPEDFIKNKLDQSKQVLSDERVFVIYNILASQIDDSEPDWREKLTKMIKKLDALLTKNTNKTATEFISTNLSTVDRRFPRFFRLASEIVEVLKSE